jgi:hypothetical protein
METAGSFSYQVVTALRGTGWMTVNSSTNAFAPRILGVRALTLRILDGFESLAAAGGATQDWIAPVSRLDIHSYDQLTRISPSSFIAVIVPL